MIHTTPSGTASPLRDPRARPRGVERPARWAGRAAGPARGARHGLLAPARCLLAVACAMAGLLAPPPPDRAAHAAPVTATYSSGPLSQPIPDLGATESTIAVGDQGSVLDVNVRVRLNHTYVEDVNLYLIGPDNTAVLLSFGNGGAGQNYGAGAASCSGTFTTFDDQAGTSIEAGAAPFAGTFRPEASLAAFNGKPAAGPWRLRVEDDQEQDAGTLFCWELQVTRDAPAPPTADLSATLSDAPDPVRAGGAVTYTLTVANAGPAAASNATATQQLPGDVTFVSATPSQGTCSRNGTAVACSLGTLAAGAGATVTVVVTAPAIQNGTASFSSSAGVQSGVQDPNPNNNATPAQPTTVFSCAPRPTVAQNVVPDGPGRVRVILTADTTPGAPGNRLRAIRFDAANNARVEIGGQVRPAPFTLPLEDRPAQFSFVVRRGDAPGGFTQPFVAIDDCGERPSFAGGGPNV